MHKMRKLFALLMVSLLALSLAIAAVGCGKKAAEEAPATTETTPATETIQSDSTMNGGTMDSTMQADTAAAH